MCYRSEGSSNVICVFGIINDRKDKDGISREVLIKNKTRWNWGNII